MCAPDMDRIGGVVWEWDAIGDTARDAWVADYDNPSEDVQGCHYMIILG